MLVLALCLVSSSRRPSSLTSTWKPKRLVSGRHRYVLRSIIRRCRPAVLVYYLVSDAIHKTRPVRRRVNVRGARDISSLASIIIDLPASRLPVPRTTPCLKNVPLWLAITLTHMNEFRYFLAETLPIK